MTIQNFRLFTIGYGDTGIINQQFSIWLSAESVAYGCQDGQVVCVKPSGSSSQQKVLRETIISFSFVVSIISFYSNNFFFRKLFVFY